MPSKKDLSGAILCNRAPLLIKHETFEALETAGNLSLQKGQRLRLQKILDSYDGLFMATEQAVDVKEVIERIEALQKAAAILRSLIDAPPNGRERSATDRALLARLRKNPAWDSASRLKNAHLLHFNGHLKIVLNEYSTRLISKDGRNRDDILDALIFDLCDFYKEAPKGTKKIRKQSVGRDSFIHTAIGIIPRHPKQSINPQALSQRIKRLKSSTRYKTAKAKS